MFSRILVTSTKNFLSTHRRLSTLSSNPIVEIREDRLHPHSFLPYVQATSDFSDTIKSQAPLKLFSISDTGGTLNEAMQVYYYEGGHKERDATLKAMQASQDMKDYLSECSPYMATQKSNLFVEAPLVHEFDAIHGLGSDFGTEIDPGEDTIFEFRRYKLILGYDTVPNFMTLYKGGFPSKIETNDPSTSLVTLLYSEVGRLNEVIEIWRHGSGTSAMERSRVGARGATEWKHAIASIAPLAIEFTSTIHRPTSFSSLR